MLDVQRPNLICDLRTHRSIPCIGLRETCFGVVQVGQRLGAAIDETLSRNTLQAPRTIQNGPKPAPGLHLPAHHSLTRSGTRFGSATWPVGQHSWAMAAQNSHFIGNPAEHHRIKNPLTAGVL